MYFKFKMSHTFWNVQRKADVFGDSESGLSGLRARDE